MMKLNLIAGFMCVVLLSACSSQRVVGGDSQPASSTSGQMSTGTTSESATTASESTSQPAKTTQKKESNTFIQADR